MAIMFLHSCRLVLLTQGWFYDVWRHFGLSQRRGGGVVLMPCGVWRPGMLLNILQRSAPKSRSTEAGKACCRWREGLKATHL